jgi:CBS domain containing-hemolysin-like protein
VQSVFTNARRLAARLAAAVPLWALAAPACASFLSGEAMDTAASVLAWVVVCVVPIVVIVLFWLVHVMPEKIAEKRHHPQKDAIHTLCLLSLVFGGLLWPIAWLWAYTKPVGYRLAYGTEKHDDYYLEMADKAKGGTLVGEEIVHLRHELDVMAQKGALPPQLRALRAELDALRVEPATGEAKAGNA